MEYLRKQKLVCFNWSYMRNEAGKDLDHLLHYCGLTIRLWWDMFRWFLTPWIIPRTVKDLDAQLDEREEDEPKDFDRGSNCINVGCLERDK